MKATYISQHYICILYPSTYTKDKLENNAAENFCHLLLKISRINNLWFASLLSRVTGFSFHLPWKHVFEERERTLFLPLKCSSFRSGLKVMNDMPTSTKFIFLLSLVRNARMESFTRKTSEKSMGNSSLMEVSNTIYHEYIPEIIANITFSHHERKKAPEYNFFFFLYLNNRH